MKLQIVRSSAATPRALLRPAALLIETAAGVPSTGSVLSAALLLAVSLGTSSARAACEPDPPSDGNFVVCIGSDSTGFDGRGADNLTITTTGVVALDDSNPALDGAILVEDNANVEIGATATVTVTQDGGFGIRGDDDNFVENKGTIVLDANDARAISIDQNTTGVLPNGAVNSGLIVINGDRGYALETGDDSGVANTGDIQILGDGGRGISGANRPDQTKPANVTNSGTIVVNGDDSFGMKLGDGWVSYTESTGAGSRTVTAEGIRNQNDIFVAGDRSVGIFARDELAASEAHNSLVINSTNSLIAVSGTDAVGISLGGNDLIQRFDLDTLDLNRFATSRPFGFATLTNSGVIAGDEDSGPLVAFHDFVSGFENRVIVTSSGRIEADLTNLGMSNRAIAILGSDGDELIVNQGTIRGRIDLLGGNDRYVHVAGAQYLGGEIDGGDGEDTALLVGSAAPQTFDLSRLVGFERLDIAGARSSNPNDPGTIWSLSNGDAFTGTVTVLDRAAFDVPTPISLGGDFVVENGGQVRVTLDDSTPPLTIAGSATLDGDLFVVQGENLAPSDTPYRVILAAGGRTGEFADIFFPNESGTRRFSAEYDPLGLLVFFQDVGLLGVARSANQRAIARNLQGLQAAGGSTGDLQALLDGIEDVDNIASVYEALSPEAYDAQTTVSVEAGRRIAALIFDRPRECEPGEVDPWTANARVLPCHARRVAPWAATLGSFRSRDAFDGHKRYDAELGGLIAGVDFQPLAGLDLTLAVSSQRGSIDVARAGQSTLTLAELTGAFSWTPGPFRLQGVVSWGHGFHQDRRRIRVDDPAAPINTRALDDHESDRTLLAAEIGYRIDAGPVSVEPLFGFDWAFIEQDGIRERQAGGFGLEIDERDDEVGSLRAGVRLASVYEHKAYLGPWLEWMTGIWRPSFDVAWRQYVEGNERDVSARFLGSPDTVGNFTIRGKEDEGGAEIGVGFRFVPVAANRLRVDLRYQAYVAEHTLEQDLVGRLSIAF